MRLFSYFPKVEVFVSVSFRDFLILKARGRYNKLSDSHEASSCFCGISCNMWSSHVEKRLLLVLEGLHSSFTLHSTFVQRSGNYYVCKSNGFLVPLSFPPPSLIFIFCVLTYFLPLNLILSFRIHSSKSSAPDLTPTENSTQWVTCFSRWNISRFDQKIIEVVKKAKAFFLFPPPFPAYDPSDKLRFYTTIKRSKISQKTT